jgi:hypothetical protein
MRSAGKAAEEVQGQSGEPAHSGDDCEALQQTPDRHERGMLTARPAMPDGVVVAGERLAGATHALALAARPICQLDGASLTVR